MIAYVATLGFFWCLVLIDLLVGGRTKLTSWVALALFILFAGLRYETGNDWVVYREYYNVASISDLLDFPEGFPYFEPLYVVLNVVLSTFLDFQWLLFFVTLFNGFILYFFCTYFKGSFPFLCTFYFSLVYLPTQMATIRYSLALSFVLIGLLFIARNKRAISVLSLLVASGFHGFALTFVPVFLVISTQKVIIRPLLFLFSGFLLQLTLPLLVQLEISEKLSTYYELRDSYGLSIAALFYCATNIFLLFFIWKRQVTFLDRLAYHFVGFFVMFSVGLWDVPVFWNRIQPMVVVLQALYIWKFLVKEKAKIASLIFVPFSFFVLIRGLDNPALITYVPYQDVLSKYFGASWVDDSGEGRFYDAVRQVEEIYSYSGRK